MHSPRGIHSTRIGAGGWEYYLQDGLSSVRSKVDASGAVLQNITYSPIGVPDSPITRFAFTGEQRDTIDVQYHRARYYKPGLGTWMSLDPFEGYDDDPMSLNGYGYVHGDPINLTDPSGEFVFGIPLAYFGIAALLTLAAALTTAAINPCLPPFVDSRACNEQTQAVEDAIELVGNVCVPALRYFFPRFISPSLAIPKQGPANNPIEDTIDRLVDNIKKLIRNPPIPIPVPRDRDLPEQEDICEPYRIIPPVFAFYDNTQITDYDLSYQVGTVYRALAETEQPWLGLLARFPGDRTVSPRSHNAGKLASPWISATKSLATAQNKFNRLGFGVVAIELALVNTLKIDLSQAVGLPPRGRFRNAAIADQEVLILDCVEKNAITYP